MSSKIFRNDKYDYIYINIDNQNKEQNALYQNKEQLLVVQDKEQNQDKEEPFGKHLLFKWGWTVQ